MKERFIIEKFNPDDKTQMDIICKIHANVLPDSFVVRMGNYFMKKFYYKILPKIGSLNCYLASYDGNYVGMIVTNKKPFSLIRSTIPNYYILIAITILISLLMNPLRISVFLELLRYKPDPLLKEKEESGVAFEILTIGVLNEFRKIVIEDNKKISHLLLKHAVSYYNGLGYKTITGQIIKTNRMAIGFYESFDAKFIQSTTRKEGVILDLPIENVIKKL